GRRRRRRPALRPPRPPPSLTAATNASAARPTASRPVPRRLHPMAVGATRRHTHPRRPRLSHRHQTHADPHHPAGPARRRPPLPRPRPAPQNTTIVAAPERTHSRGQPRRSPAPPPFDK